MTENDKRSESEKTSLKEQAINHKESDGKEINQQEQKRRQKHQPRDNA
jgi:hypothetical protein